LHDFGKFPNADPEIQSRNECKVQAHILGSSYDIHFKNLQLVLVLLDVLRGCT
jgi:hypothetical protein